MRSPTTTSASPRAVPGGGSTVNNMTRDEAQHRARLLRVDGYDIALDLTVGGTTFRSETTVTFSCLEPGATTYLDLTAESVREVDPQRGQPQPRRGLRRQPDQPAGAGRGQHAARRRRLRLHEHRRGPAPVRRPGGQEHLPLHPVRDVRRPPHVRLLRPARPQGDLPLHRDHAGGLEGRHQHGGHHRVGGRRCRACVPTTLPSPGGCRPTSPRSSPAPTTGCSTPTPPPTARRSRWASTAARRWPSTSTPTRSSRSPSRASTSSTSCSTSLTPSASTTSCSSPSSTPGRWRTPAP